MQSCTSISAAEPAEDQGCSSTRWSEQNYQFNLLKIGHPSLLPPACSTHMPSLCTGSGAYRFQIRSPWIITSGTRLTQKTEYFGLDKWATLAYLVIIKVSVWYKWNNQWLEGREKETREKQELSIWVAEGYHLHPAVMWSHSVFFTKDLPDWAGCMVGVLVYVQRRRQACTAQTYCHIQTVKPCSKPATERGSPLIPLNSHPPTSHPHPPTPFSHWANKTEEMTQGKAFIFFPPCLALVPFSSLFGSSCSLKLMQGKPGQEWTTRKKCSPLAGSI